MQSKDLLFNEKTELDRKLGLPATISIIVNRIIGSGIFRTPASIMLVVGSVSLFYGVWVIGGVATILGALCYAELVAMMPQSGGPYVFLKAAYPPFVTFLRGWAMFFVSETGAIAAVSLFFSENLFSLIPATYNFLMPLAAIFIVVFLTIANMYGMRLSGALQNLFSISKILVLLLIIFVSLINGLNPKNFISSQEVGHGGWMSLVAIMSALRYGFFAYSGWEGATYVAEEVKNPRKNLPKSLFVGISFVIIIYIFVNTAYLNLLPPGSIAESRVVAVDAMEVAIGPIAIILVATAIMISTFGNVNSQILVKSRTWYAMARDGLFFKKLGKIDPNFKTPNNSLAAQAFWASVLILFASFAERAYETVIDFFSFTSSIFNILTFYAVFILRRKYPDAPRPYKIWAYPLPLIVVLTIHLTFMIITLITAFIPSILGILLTSSGFIYYKWFVPEEAKKN